MARSERDAHRRRGSRLIVGGAVIAVVFGVGGGFIGSALTTTSGSAAPRLSRSASCSVTTVANDDLPSVVTISVRTATGGGTGSGEVIRSDGYVLTNNHVVAAAATGGGSISVRLNDGTDVGATLVGRDPLTDVAVIKLNGASKLRAIPIGNSTTVVIGQPVIVLGAPLGLSSTVTSGIVSALDRTITVPGGGSTPPAFLLNALQTDAAINPGNSGGALVDCAGKFIGMPSAGASVPSSSGEASGGNIGLGFAIPVNVAIKEANELIETGHVTRAYLGLQAVPVPAEASATTGKAQGLFVTGVDGGSPAQTAGLRSGDVLTTITGKPAERTDQLVGAVLEHRPGDVLTLGYDRGGSTHTTKVTLGAQPPTRP